MEASKIRSEQKEEEVKILEQLVKELEGTINVLEKKVSLYQHFLMSCSILKQKKKSCLEFLLFFFSSGREASLTK